MSAKKWTITFVSIILVVLAAIAIINYVVDPYGYFDGLDGLNEELNDNNYIRVLKAKHIQKYGDQYEGYVIGGSKAGGYTSKIMEELDGYNYYNCFITMGNFEEYYIFTKHIIEYSPNVKRIVLNLSGFECLFDVREGIKQETPAVLSGKSEAVEFVKFLFKNPKLSYDQVFNPEFDYRQNDDGSRNLTGAYEEYLKDPNEYVRNNVIYDLEEDLQIMFDNAETRTFSSFPNDMRYLRQIVDLCKENDIDLLVINSATPLTSRQSYEGEAYWNFLAQVATVTDFWDFTSYNDINLNPYNFYDDAHPFYEVVELLINTIAGKNSYEGFGYYVTKDNVYDYLQERRNDFYELKYEFEQTGSVRLNERKDESNLLRNGGTYQND